MIRFSKYIWLYFFISACVLSSGTYSLVRWGLRPAIDFTGGILIEFRSQTPLTETVVRDTAASSNLPVVLVQQSDANTFLIRGKPAELSVLRTFETAIASASGNIVEILRNETVGPVLGKELLEKATVAALVAIMAILAYVAYAFKNIRFGVSAVIALTHDLLVVLGIFSLLGHFKGVEVDTLFVTAFLTTMSFSVHDTIVVFDRIREYQKKRSGIPFVEICDQALMETMGRSLTNSLTIIFMLLALVLMGGDSVRWFVVALLIGTVSGTYSSPFVATPILILWDKWDKRKRKV